MSSNHQKLSEQNIDETLVERLVDESNSRISIRDKTKNTYETLSRDINKAIRRAKAYWELHH